MVNRCPVVDVTVDHGRDDGDRRASSRPTASGSPSRARCVVNAAGVWADEVRALDEADHPDSIRPAKGVHITVPWDKVRNDIAVVIPVPQRQRSLFVVPWGPRPDGTFEHVYIGTTDTDYDGPLDDPQCTADDIDYVLRALNGARSTHRAITADDITGIVGRAAAAGEDAPDARAATADLSRRHQVRRRASTAWSRSPAASSRPTARWPRTPSTWSSSVSARRGALADRPRGLQLLGADGLRRRAEPGTARAPPRPPLRHGGRRRSGR